MITHEPYKSWGGHLCCSVHKHKTVSLEYPAFLESLGGVLEKESSIFKPVTNRVSFRRQIRQHYEEK